MLPFLAQVAPATPVAPAPGFFETLFGSAAAKPGPTSIPEILFALLFSFALNSLIAAVYKRTYRDARQLNAFVAALQVVNGNNRVLVTRAAEQGETDSD